MKIDGRRKPKTPEQKAELSRIQTERKAREKAEKEAKAKLVSGAGDATAKSGDGVGDRGGADVGASSGADPGGGGGGSVTSDKPSTGTGRKIPKPKTPAEKQTEIVLEKGKILAGLPSFYILCLKAVNNIFKFINLFLPVNISFDPMTAQEAELVNNVVRPSIEKNLKVLGEDHPVLCLVGVGGTVLVGKMNITAKGKKINPEGAHEVKPEENLKVGGGKDE